MYSRKKRAAKKLSLQSARTGSGWGPGEFWAISRGGGGGGGGGGVPKVFSRKDPQILGQHGICP